MCMASMCITKIRNSFKILVYWDNLDRDVRTVLKYI